MSQSSILMTLSYEGSVKNVYRDLTDTKFSYFQFTDDYSVFDWGKMPDKIFQKGQALSMMGGWFFRLLSQPESWRQLAHQTRLLRQSNAYINALFDTDIYENLCQYGLRNHFVDWVNDEGEAIDPDDFIYLKKAPLMCVQSVNVDRPNPWVLDNMTLYDYPDMSTKLQGYARLIPLEVVFRFGMPTGSSLIKRMQQRPDYYTDLGLIRPPAEGEWFERPVVEFFTKLEPTDAFISAQHAYELSNLTAPQFDQLYKTTLLLSLWLYHYFDDKGIELWDGKFEWAWDDQGLILVDSISPDELRLLRNGVHLSKECIRRFYRNTDWEKAVNEAKSVAHASPNADWKTVCKEYLGQQPQPLDRDVKHVMDNLYAALINHCFGPILHSSMTLDEVIDATLKLEQSTGA